MTSSTTTKIIAPAANASAYGRSGCASVTAAAPATAATGSTTADSWPYHQLRRRDSPSRLKGTATAVPSGQFCSPMPIASATAPANVAPS